MAVKIRMVQEKLLQFFWGVVYWLKIPLWYVFKITFSVKETVLQIGVDGKWEEILFQWSLQVLPGQVSSSPRIWKSHMFLYVNLIFDKSYVFMYIGPCIIVIVEE